ncbi:hypothetical protein QEN19_001465 [Hanseniaspora menglaensis]
MAIILRIRFSTEIKDLKVDITKIQPEALTPEWIRALIRDTFVKRNESKSDGKQLPINVPIKLIRMGKVLRGKQYGKFVSEVEHYQKQTNEDELLDDKQFYINAMIGSPEDFVGVDEEVKKDQLNRSGLEWFKSMSGQLKKRKSKSKKAGLSVTHGNVMINIPGALAPEQAANEDGDDEEEDEEYDEDDSREGQNLHVQGLDRLVDMGFSQQEIQDLREQFRQRMRYESGEMIVPDEYLEEDNNMGTDLTRHISQDGFLDLENGFLLKNSGNEIAGEEEDFKFTDEEILSFVRRENIMRSVDNQEINERNQVNFQTEIPLTHHRHRHAMTEQERLLQLEEQFFQSVQEDMNTDISGIQKITSLKLNLEILLGVFLGISLGFGNFFVFIFMDSRMMSPTLERTIIISLMTSFLIGVNRS